MQKAIASIPERLRSLIELGVKKIFTFPPSDMDLYIVRIEGGVKYAMWNAKSTRKRCPFKRCTLK